MPKLNIRTYSALHWAFALLLVSMLVLAACSDGTQATPTAQVTPPTVQATPTTQATPPTAQATPTTQATPMAQATPTTQATPMAQATPTPRPTPMAQATPTPQPTPTSQAMPTPPSTPVSQADIVAQLRKNAEEFEYTIGKPGGSLTFATISEPLTLNLAISNDASSSGVLGYLFEGLTETSWLTDQVEPALAESWKHSDDGLTWTFNLRRDVTWHDGQPFTAQDVDFTFNRIIYNDDIPASSRSSFNFRFLDEESGEWQEAQMTVTALDEYTVECVLPVSFAPFLRSMGTAIYPEHILEKHVDDGTFTATWGH